MIILTMRQSLNTLFTDGFKHKILAYRQNTDYYMGTWWYGRLETEIITRVPGGMVY